MKGQLTAVALSGLAIAMLAVLVTLQLTVHDPHHVLLTVAASWGVLSIPIGMLVGHFARGPGSAIPDLSEDE